MNKKLFVRLVSLLIGVLVAMSMLSACGANSSKDTVYNGYARNELAEVDDSLTDTSASGNVEENADLVKDSRKIIEKIYYQIQTKTFDELISDLEEQVDAVGGYIESSDVYGNQYESNNTRGATYVFRIPSEKVDEFTTFVNDNSTVTNRTVNTEDVTLQYVDTESRIKALKTEKDSLEDLLENAKSTSEIIEIRDMLTDVIYEIETYEAQLRTYDNLIDYTTITMEVDEVEHTKVVHKQTAFERIVTNFTDSCMGVWNILVEFFVFIVGSLPVLLFIALIIFILVIIIRAVLRKKKKKAVKLVKTENFVTNETEELNTEEKE
ncbi:MAG: DUF4349 domain-containing protein [Ruminococcaceae bacterium]|nr:DUF4349 domain-containing protein [Oscillospiraceae bacterium]